MAECPYCESVVDDNNPALLCERIEEALKHQWSNFESDGAYEWSRPVGKVFEIEGVGTAEVVDKKVKAVTSEFSEGYYYGGGDELPQGTTFRTYVILKVGEHFFRKEGEGDSYSDIVWAGPVKPVKPKTELRTVYVFG